jgi:outer membrane protein assembly factor BamB
VIHEGLVFLNFGPGLNAFVVALDKQTGKEVWRKQFPGQRSEEIGEFRGSWSTPVVHRQGDRAVLLLALPGTLRALDPATGNDVWTCDGLGALVYTSPLIAGDVVIAMSGYGGPALAVKSGGTGDVTATHRLWRHETPKPPQRVGSGVIVGPHLYILNEPGVAWCLDVQTGEKKWEERRTGGNSWTSMVHAGGRIYAGNTAGTTFVLAVNPEKCEILAENKLGELTRASPALVDGQVFIRAYENLYCLEAK